MATTFIYFPLLPTEIRLQIWALAQPQRILRIHIVPDSCIPERPTTALTNFHAYESRLSRPFYFRSLTPLPAPLGVNHESRQETLRSYTVVCDDSGPRLHYNALRDTLWIEAPDYLDDWTMLVDRVTKAGARVPRLAIHDNGNHGSYQPKFAQQVLTAGIEELFLVFENVMRMPSVWQLVPRPRENNGVDRRLYMESIGHRYIILQLKRLKEKTPDVSLPRITAVEKAFWEKEGSLSEWESQEVVLGEEFIEKSRKLIRQIHIGCF